MHKINKKECRVEKVITEKVINYMLNGKTTTILFNSKYFAKLRLLGGNVEVEYDLSNYSAKADLKNAAGIDTLKFVKKVDLASLNLEIDKFDIDKLETILTDLSKLSD